ncbi:hypothetical protein ACTFIY_003253 [Dictyostelium cf. discoideum]
MNIIKLLILFTLLIQIVFIDCVYGSGFGSDASALSFKIGSSNYNSPNVNIDIDDTVASFVISSLGEYNGLLKVILGLDTYDYGEIEITPTLKSIILPAGGNLGTQYPSEFKIVGDNFDASRNGAEILYNGINITDCKVTSRSNTIPAGYSCTIPSGVGSFVISVKVASKFSNNITMWYDPPGIQIIYPTFFHSDSLITIYGQNFEPYSKDRTIVTIDDIEMDVVSSNSSNILVKHDNTLKPVNGNTFKIIVNGLDIFDIFNPNWNYTDFFLNNISVKNYCRINPYPGYEDQSDLFVLFSPYVLIPSTQKINDIPPKGGEITFIGKHFDTTLFDGSPNNLVINFNGKNYTNYNLINNTYMTFNIPPGIGTNNYLFISSN